MVKVETKTLQEKTHVVAAIIGKIKMKMEPINKIQVELTNLRITKTKILRRIITSKMLHPTTMNLLERRDSRRNISQTLRKAPEETTGHKQSRNKNRMKHLVYKKIQFKKHQTELIMKTKYPKYSNRFDLIDVNLIFHVYFRISKIEFLHKW